MLTGRIVGSTGRPYIEARLFLPRIQVSGNISLLVDTDADSSLLMPGDATRLSLPYNRLTCRHSAFGLGGQVSCYEEEAILAFTDPGVAVYAYALDLHQPVRHCYGGLPISPRKGRD
jgi:hypothetical protein